MKRDAARTRHDDPLDVDVLIVTDDPSRAADVARIVDPHYHQAVVTRTAFAEEVLPSVHLLIFDVDLHDGVTVRAVRDRLADLDLHDVPRLFVLSEPERRDILQANTMSAGDYVARPLVAATLVPIITKLVSGAVERSWESLTDIQRSALKISLKSFEDCFASGRDGRALPIDDVKEGSNLVLDAVRGDGLDGFMKTVRSHHNYTFRHSMFVCGLLGAFGFHVGARGSDLKLISLGAMLHDMGKARTPLAVLDKPGRLTDEEFAIMRRHPADGETMLRDLTGLDKDVIWMATRHHEKLDGSGYPFGLKGAEISDLVRLISIVDVYSALIDKRSYKPALPVEKALDIMASMEGHLDPDLLSTFREVVMD